MKIPFDIKFRPQIESGEYKVETFSGYPVTIYRWDFDDDARTPIMGSYVFEDNKEYVGAWNEEGHFDLMSPNDLDLFVITPGPELSEFEKAVGLNIFDEPFEERHIKVIKEESAKLLALARKELEPEVLERLEVAYKNQDEVVYENGKREGKAEALKDLPRWKTAVGYCFVGLSIMYDDHGFYKSSTTKPECRYINYESLRMLPGFNE